MGHIIVLDFIGNSKRSFASFKTPLEIETLVKQCEVPKFQLLKPLILVGVSRYISNLDIHIHIDIYTRYVSKSQAEVLVEGLLATEAMWFLWAAISTEFTYFGGFETWTFDWCLHMFRTLALYFCQILCQSLCQLESSEEGNSREGDRQNPGRRLSVLVATGSLCTR